MQKLPIPFSDRISISAPANTINPLKATNFQQEVNTGGADALSRRLTHNNLKRGDNINLVQKDSP